MMKSCGLDAQLGKATSCIIFFEVIKPKVQILSISEEASVAEVKFRSHFLVVRKKLQNILPRNVDVMEDFVWWTSHGFILQF